MKSILYALGLSGALLLAPVSMAETTAAESTATAVVAAADQAALTAAQTTATTEAVQTTAAPEPSLNKGDTAWMIVATALVLFMTIPGLALFYGGMVRRKNILGTLMHSFGATAVVTVIWVVAGYSLAFTDGVGAFAPYLGDLSKAMISGVTINTLWGTIPELLFVVFQLTFAIITVAILSGSFAERIKFSSFMVFAALWVLVVYSPICHWVWQSSGWLFSAGALDYAGGTVVHINAGVAGLVAAYVIGKRVGYGKEPMAPHNLVLTLIGAGMLWVGWFGFNAGSALAADGRAAMAVLVTQIAAASAAVSWMGVEAMIRGKASLLGGVSGAVAGLVVITPASGFVDVSGAMLMGLIGGAACFFSVNYLKRLLKVDDSLDAFGLHAIGGIIGAMLTAVFVSESVTGTAPAPLLKQLFIQAEGVLATIAYSAIMTYVVIKLVDVTMGLRVAHDDERMGLDLSQHGERVEA